MIIPGLDRLEGTAVSPELLNSDELWHEHTSEILDLFQEENAGRPAEEWVSMVQFCAAYASGKRTTLAMRRAEAKKDWRIDPLAVKLLAESNKAKQAPITEPPKQEPLGRRFRQKGKGPLIARVGTKKKVVAIPGVVFAAGAAYPYREENSKIRTALKRFREIVSRDGFYCTPEHSHHVTIATLQKFQDNEEIQPTALINVDQITAMLRASPAFLLEVQKGPITLVSDRLEIPSDGDTIVLLFKDKENRVEQLRQVIRSVLGDSAPDLRVPTFVHSSLARVAAFPSCSRSVLLQKLQGILEDITIHIETTDLILEDRDPYLTLFPEGGIAHWDLHCAPSSEANDEASHEVAVAAKPDEADSPIPPKTSGSLSFLPKPLIDFLGKDESVVVSIVLIAFSAIVAWSRA